ncbi:TPA: ATP-dependent DNA helicase RecG [Candidatus Dojkabacteria bacterium]|uniref:Probable DNA 3'-5' helicase RecG n=1 Tax=Candidatus Dojkabacteria bacterium TaxID=2099670 RepID=A0A832QDN4_9BACT|nr:ATP-dependent DNA helicase RecG [Candidatus Dojkabacteria bacterium]
MLTKDTPISELKGIGPKSLYLYENLGIHTVRDLLFHIPFRYQDTSEIISIKEFKERGEGTFLAEIEDVKTTYFRKKTTTVKVKDDTDTLRLTYFNQSYLQKTLQKGDIYIFDAKYSTSRNGKTKNIYNPKFEKFKYEKEKQLHVGKIVGVYPETKGLTSAMLRRKIADLQDDIPKILDDPLEKHIGKSNLQLPFISKAIEKVHFPNGKEDIDIAKQRLSFDEMLRVAIKIEREKEAKRKEKTKKIPLDSKVLNNFIKSLPYKLTDDQNKAVEEILSDCNNSIPMTRLLNGDVGSGKTVVAGIAILNCIKNGFSSILLAPTTVLAKQHFETFTKLFKDFNIDIELCISSNKNISDADNKLIIGTHAILYDMALPKDLNLVIIDEQHRFGVEQREYFREKGKYSPHYLTMTATPIPRSLTEIFFGGLDVSEIKEKPKGRIEVKTYYTPVRKRLECFEWVKEKILESKGENQAFFIYPLIEETEKSTRKSVLNEYESLKEIFKGLKVKYLHGKLKEEEKSKLLEDFREKKIDILVSTTVIEVGIDIPDATIMVVEDAERFGLAQLHQLRGRVGRSDKESYCFVLPSSSVERGSPAEERLLYFSKHSSGFDVAQYDLQTRGPGEVYGTRQSGIPIFKVADIYDVDLLKRARSFAKKLIKEDNDLEYILDNLFR